MIFNEIPHSDEKPVGKESGRALSQTACANPARSTFIGVDAGMQAAAELDAADILRENAAIARRIVNARQGVNYGVL